MITYSLSLQPNPSHSRGNEAARPSTITSDSDKISHIQVSGSSCCSFTANVSLPSVLCCCCSKFSHVDANSNSKPVFTQDTDRFSLAHQSHAFARRRKERHKFHVADSSAKSDPVAYIDNLISVNYSDTSSGWNWREEFQRSSKPMYV